jgi:short subunit fatty acids transporter
MSNIRGTAARKSPSSNLTDVIEVIQGDGLDNVSDDILGKTIPTRQTGCCGFRWREVVMVAVIIILAVVVAALVDKQEDKELSPYCLFALGGGYLEGSESTP